MSTRSRSRKNSRSAKTKPMDKGQLAERMQLLANGFRIRFSPNMEIVGDPESKGHLFSGYVIDDEDEETHFRLDDRKGDLDQQLMAEMHRVGRVYFRKAAEFAAECGKPVPRTIDSMQATPSHNRLALSEWGYPDAHKIIKWLIAQSPWLSVTWDGQHAKVEVTSPEVEMLVRMCEPIRMQIIKELQRVANYFQYLAGCLEETDYCDEEIENFSRDQKTIEWIVKPPKRLLANRQEAKVAS